MLSKYKCDIEYTVVRNKRAMCKKCISPIYQRFKFKKNYNHFYINNRMLLYLSDTNQQTTISELTKVYRKSGIQIANGNEKLDTMLIQVNAS